MRMKIAGALALALSACSTVSQDTALDPQGTEAFVMVATDGRSLSPSETLTYTFRQINVGNSTFTRQHASVFFNNVGPGAQTEFRAADGAAVTLRFGGRALPPGDYALISRTTSRSAPGAQLENTTCYSEGAVVFRMRPGVINLVHTAGPAGLASARREAAMVLQNYPNMTAPVEPAEAIGTATFNTTQWLGRELCTTGDPPVFTPLSQPSAEP
jgi:hypothetical protein